MRLFFQILLVMTVFASSQLIHAGNSNSVPSSSCRTNGDAYSNVSGTPVGHKAQNNELRWIPSSRSDFVKLVVHRDGTSICLGEFFFPFSYEMHSEPINVPGKKLLVTTLDSSEPEPTASYLYAIVDFESGELLLSGYSDSPVRTIKKANRISDLVVVGRNILGTDARETLIDIVPYPIVIGWNCDKTLAIADIRTYPEIQESYLEELDTYQKKLSSMINKGGRDTKMIRAEFELSQSISRGFRDRPKNIGAMANQLCTP